MTLSLQKRITLWPPSWDTALPCGRRFARALEMTVQRSQPRRAACVETGSSSARRVFPKAEAKGKALPALQSRPAPPYLCSLPTGPHVKRQGPKPMWEPTLPGEQETSISWRTEAQTAPLYPTRTSNIQIPVCTVAPGEPGARGACMALGCVGSGQGSVQTTVATRGFSTETTTNGPAG